MRDQVQNHVEHHMWHLLVVTLYYLHRHINTDLLNNCLTNYLLSLLPYISNLFNNNLWSGMSNALRKSRNTTTACKTLFVPKLNVCTYKQSGLDVSIRMKIIEKALEWAQAGWVARIFFLVVIQTKNIEASVENMKYKVTRSMVLVRENTL